MPHLLHVWPSVSRTIEQAASLLLLFDYDGTLTPIVDRPDLAELSPAVQCLLSTLRDQDKYLVGVISGRSLEDVRERVGVEGLTYAGNHGLEIRGPQIEFLHGEAASAEPGMRKAYQQLSERLAPLPGVIVEHKGLTLSVHYRLAPNELVGAVVEAVEEEAYAGDGSTRFKVTRGKQVVELRPDVEWGKGQAIAQLQVTFPEIPLTMFFGDDVTDEDGFDAVMNGGGLAVFVGPPRHPTRALYRLDSPVEVAQVLRLLAAW